MRIYNFVKGLVVDFHIIEPHIFDTFQNVRFIDILK
jgi:hypothetical protein